MCFAITICLFLFIFVQSELASGGVSSRHPQDVKNPARDNNVLLVPKYSTTTLMCDPMFSLVNGTGVWFRNGVVIANVSSESNAVLHGRVLDEGESIPSSGFLVLVNITLDDEGDYWCHRLDTGKESSVVRLQVAFIEKLPDNSHPEFHPSAPELGEEFVALCPKTEGNPRPSIVWALNNHLIQPAPNRVNIMKNGSLVIKRFLFRDIGIYECRLSNFAGSTSSKGFVDMQKRSDESIDMALFAANCPNLIQGSHTTWFLIGCLVTSGLVLAYLLCAMTIVKSNDRSRMLVEPSSYLQSHSSLAPGFRKLISPIPNIYIAPRSDLQHQ